MIQSDFVAVRELNSLFKHLGVEDVVLSPGSRNAPFILQFSNDTSWNIESIVDERTAGFFALGQAMYAQVPSVLCCTSGSALLNYLPAVSEAVYSDIPMIILSADRPSSFLDQGHPQTINQKGVFRTLGITTLDIEGTNRLNPEDYETIIRNKIVHINVHFTEPLYNTTRSKLDQPIAIPPIAQAVRFSEINFPKLERTQKIWLIIGQFSPLDQTIVHFVQECEAKGMIIFSENTSNIDNQYGIDKIDLFLNSVEKLPETVPDVVVTFQRPLISNRVIRYLRKHSEHLSHINIGNTYETGWNTLNASYFIHCLDIQQFQQIELTPSTDYKTKVCQQFGLINARANTVLSKTVFSDLFVVREALKLLPIHSHIHWSNSSPIRYAQLVDYRQHYHYCNRGVSGIEGSTTTAMGFSNKASKPVYLITGELSFLYDSNIWWNTKQLRLKVILINNSGGDIFRIIPGPNQFEKALPYFTTPKKVNFEALAQSVYLDYFEIDEASDFRSIFDQFLNTPESALLNINTGTHSAQVLADFWKQAKVDFDS